MADDNADSIIETAPAPWRVLIDAIGPALELEGQACDRENRFVAWNLDRLHDAGLFAMAAPADLGGGGADPVELGAMLRAVARWDGSTALTLSMHTHQVAIATWRRANAGAPTEGVLKKVAQEGVRIVSSGGSDWLPGSGKAERVEGGYRVTARKIFSSGCLAGDLLMTSAIHDDPVDGPTVLHFAAPMKAKEVQVLETWDTLGMRGTGSHDVLIDGLLITDAQVAGKRPAGKWHPLFHVTSMIAFPLVYAVYAGVADGMRAAALAAAQRRGADAALVGELETAHRAMSLTSARMLEIARDGQPGPETTDDVMALRSIIGRQLLDVADLCLEIAGGAGFYRAPGLEQRFRDLQASRYHPLQARAQRAFAGRMALGRDIDG